MTTASRTSQTDVSSGRVGASAARTVIPRSRYRAGYEHAPVPPSGPQTWHLAPITMRFENSEEVDGLKRAADICRSIKAAAGSPQNVVTHVNVDNLVKWAFDPGAGRTPAHPRGHSYFVDKLREWANKGGACPD